MKRVQLVCASLIIGASAGLLSTLLLFTLLWATEVRLAHPEIIWLLPLIGMATVWLYQRVGNESIGGTGLILDEIHQPLSVLPTRMAPLIYGATTASHLCGASVGREGSALQMSAAISDCWIHLFSRLRDSRSTLLRASVGAAFGSATGAPFAGFLFGLEIDGRSQKKVWHRFSLEAVIVNAICSASAFLFTWLLSAPHTHYPAVELPHDWLSGLLYSGLAGVCFGCSARFYSWLCERLEHGLSLIGPLLRPLVAGVFLAIIFAGLGQSQFAGLGLEGIQTALKQPTSFLDALAKMGLTAGSITAGFRGGEFIPIVFVGATIGSAVASWIGTQSFLAALGFGSVFSALSKTPFSCTVMICEIFGWNLLLFALVSTLIADRIAGSIFVYKAYKPLGSN